MPIPRSLPKLIAIQLASVDSKLRRAKVLVGLDGFVDTILHVVKTRVSATKYERMSAMKDFAAKIDQDLASGRETAPVLLAAAFSRRLKQLGYVVPEVGLDDPLLRLYRLLEETRPDAHAYYNALLRRMVSFAQAAECVR